MRSANPSFMSVILVTLRYTSAVLSWPLYLPVLHSKGVTSVSKPRPTMGTQPDESRGPCSLLRNRGNTDGEPCRTIDDSAYRQEVGPADLSGFFALVLHGRFAT